MTAFHFFAVAFFCSVWLQKPGVVKTFVTHSARVIFKSDYSRLGNFAVSATIREKRNPLELCVYLHEFRRRRALQSNLYCVINQSSTDEVKNRAPHDYHDGLSAIEF